MAHRASRRARLLLAQLPRQREAQRGGCHGGEPSGFDHAHAAHLYDLCDTRRIADQRRDIVSGSSLPLGQQPHMVLDAAQDGEVVFVDVEDFHGDSARLAQDAAIGVERLLRGARP